MFNFLASFQIVAMKNKTEINNTLQVSKKAIIAGKQELRNTVNLARDDRFA